MIDNFDSFTYNLVNQLKSFMRDIKVYRNDTPTQKIFELCKELGKKVIIVISPGPGSPKTAGNVLELLKEAKGIHPILGVCLGHQAIIESYGSKIAKAKSVVHGKSHLLNITSKGEPLFAGITPFSAARYHSLSAKYTPKNLEVLATCDEEVMLVKEPYDNVYGIQFHPESILTPNGSELINRILNDMINCQDKKS